MDKINQIKKRNPYINENDGYNYQRYQRIRRI